MNEQKMKFRKWNLYRKEQWIITIILLCFVLSGIQLPKIKAQSSTSPVVNTETPEETEPENVVKPGSKETVASSKDTTTVSENESLEETTVPKAEKKTDSNDGNTETKQDSKPKKNSKTQNNTSKKASSQTKKPNSEKTDSAPVKEEKVWVPPVYETIHHDAVYETKRVAICNYCSETFDSVGDFQVHKNEYGGCAGLHTTCRVTNEEVLVKEAWDETVLVSEGYYK